MLTRFLIFAILLGAAVLLNAQPIQSRIIHRLLNEKEAINHIHHSEFKGLFLHKIDSKYQKNKQYLIKTLNGLFFGVEGTGCIYKVVEDANGWVDLIRIDSTVYAGNNFCAANFTLDSSIYSFGGYGFWRTNGLLKSFNFFSKEWDVIPLSDEKPSIFCESGSGVHWNDMDSSAADTQKYGTAYAPSMFWVNPEKKLFYEITQRLVNEAIGDSSQGFRNHFTPAVNVLDLRTKKWEQLGYLIDYGWHHLVQTPWGLLVIGNSENIYLADFDANTRQLAKEEYMPAYRKLFVNDPPQVIFYSNGYVYMGAIDNNSYDSIPFEASHFRPSDKPLYRIYTNPNSSFELPALLVSPWFLYPSGIALGVLLGFSLLGVFKNKFEKENGSLRTIINTSVTAAERVNMLTQTERGLIELIYTVSLKGERATMEEVNRAIGVAGKTEPIKRRVRSEIINSINEKWMIISASRERLIESFKPANDKRAREYFISTEILASAIFNDLLQKNNEYES
jgi:hypothetical protein